MECVCLSILKRNIERLDKIIMKHIVKIFNLTNNTSYQRLRLILAEPSVEIRLIKRLLKIYHKYRDHFGVSADKYREQLLE